MSLIRGSYSGPHNYNKPLGYQTGGRYSCFFYHSNLQYECNKLSRKCNKFLEECDKLREKANLRWYKKCNAYDRKAEILWEKSNKLVEKAEILWRKGNKKLTGADTKG